MVFPCPKTWYFLPVWFFERYYCGLKSQMKDAHQTDAGMFASIPFIHNHRTEPRIISDQIILNTRMSSKWVAKYWRVVLWNMWQIALQNEMFRESLLNTQSRWESHTHDVPWLTEQEQFHLPRSLLSIVPEVFVDHLWSFGGRLVFCAHRAAHDRTVRASIFKE